MPPCRTQPGGHIHRRAISIRNVPIDGLRSKLPKTIIGLGQRNAQAMTRSADPIRRAIAARRRHELYARLGLTPQATHEDVQGAHDELVKFLKGAPDGVSGWAQGEIAAADKAIKSLTTFMLFARTT